MMVETLIQPEIERPKQTDPLYWAWVSTRLHFEWIRSVGPQLNLNVDRYILGKLLHTILYDDANNFTWTLGGRIFDIDKANHAKLLLMERVKCEVETPELPSIIRQNLEPIIDLIEDSDWSDFEQFNRVKDRWYSFKGWTEELVRDNLDYREAIDYASCKNRLINPYWKMFLSQDR
jgi:hypothetical protein